MMISGDNAETLIYIYENMLFALKLYKAQFLAISILGYFVCPFSSSLRKIFHKLVQVDK